MKKISEEKILMAKSLKEVDGPWEMIAFIWAWRRKEFLFYTNLIQSAIIIYFVLKYTSLVQVIIKKIF